MAARPQSLIRFLQIVHLTIFLLGISVISILHIKTEQFWDALRLPTFLKEIDDFLGFAYPASLHIYQSILIFTLVLAAIDAAGLFFYKKRIWKLLSDLTSFLALLIVWPAALFFVFTLATAQDLTQTGIQTIYIYFGYLLFVFILDLTTWFVDEQSLIKLGRKRK